LDLFRISNLEFANLFNKGCGNIDSKDREGSYFLLFKNKNFLALWIGQAISNLGDWIIVIALIELIYKLSGSGLAVGTLMMFKILPALLFGSIMGVLVDRMNRKRTMILCDAVRGGLILLLPFVRNMFQIYLIAFLLETFSLLFMPAKDASIPNIVKRKEILTANSISYTTNNLTMILGVTFGSTIIILVEKVWKRLLFFQRLTGPNAAFYVDALTFFISALAIATIYLPASKLNEKKINYTQVKDDIIEGIKFLKENQMLRVMLSSVGVAILGAGSIYSLGVVYSYEVLKVASGGFGYLLATLGLGLTLGSLFSGFFGRHFSKERLFNNSIFTFGVALLLFAAISRFELALIFSFIGGIALASLTVSAYTILQETVADEMRGRTFTALESLLRISLLISLGFTGALADIIGRAGSISIGSFSLQLNGARTTLFLGGVVVIIASFYAFKHIKSGLNVDLRGY
jgi:dTMP kinase